MKGEGRESCEGCPERCAEPNCHNAEICAYWARHEAAQSRAYEERAENSRMARIPWSFEKGTNGRGHRYCRGNKENIARKRKGMETVKEGRR